MRWLNIKLLAKVSHFFILLLLVLFVGALGYLLIEDYGLVDAFYMTVITISTVGYMEVQPLSSNGKIFTIFLIITSLGTFAYALSSITTFIIGGQYRRFVKENNLMNKIEKLSNHVIVCGFGGVGKQVAEDLEVSKIPFVVLENNNEVISENESKFGYIFLKEDATADDALDKANLRNAKSVISCLPKDSDNLYVVLSAREKSPNVLIVSRAMSPSATSKLKFAGANNVILPDTIGGSHMASLVSNPDVMEFLDMVRVQGEEGVNINSISYEELPDNFRNKTIGQIDAEKITGVNIIGYKTNEGKYIVNPDDDLVLIPNSSLFVLGSNEQIMKFKTTFGLKH